MAINRDLVDEISSSQRVLKDIVEYPWLAGCTPTAVTMVVGYWDRNGYDNLIVGDSSYFNENVHEAMASPQHYASYAYPMEDSFNSGPIYRDASHDGGVHDDNSVADFLLTSRSSMNLRFGATRVGLTGVGFHGYATHRGYDDFKSYEAGWSSSQFSNIMAEIDAGRPVVLTVDAKADGRLDHSVTVFGYDSAKKKLLIHDGWETTSEPRWISATGLKEGHQFGIHSVTYIRPGEVLESAEDSPNFFRLYNDGSNSASGYRAILGEDGSFVYDKLSSDVPYSRTNTGGIATADGHRFFQLYKDGSGTTALYVHLSNGGSGDYYYKKSADSRIGTDALDFATADGKIFYLLTNDGKGTAALWKSVLQSDGTFSNTLLNSDCGLSRSTVGFSTTDGKTFYQLLNDGFSTAASYRCELQADGTFVATLLNENANLGRTSVGLAAWETNDPTIILGTAEDDVLYGGADDNTIRGGAGFDQLYGGRGDDFLDGGAGDWDSVIYDGVVSDYVFTLNADGSVTVEHPVHGTDTLADIENVWFRGELKLYALSELAQSSSNLDVTHGSSEGDELVIHEDNQTIMAGEGDDAVTLVGTGGTAYGEAGSDKLYGSGAKDHLDGGVGNDLVFGHGGDDILVGGAGDDWLVGGAGNDLFVFHAGSGSDGIADFEVHDGTADGDVIELHGQSAGDFDGLMADAEEWGGNSHINLDDDDTIVLYNVSLDQLSADDFAFA